MKEVVTRPQLLQERKKDFWISFALTGGLALLFAVMPNVSFSSYVSTMEMHALQSIPADQLMPLLANLEEVRQSLFTSDAWRSFFIIVIGAGLVWAYGMGKLKQVPMVFFLDNDAMTVSMNESGKEMTIVGSEANDILDTARN